jgi:hypothetical protein
LKRDDGRKKDERGGAKSDGTDEKHTFLAQIRAHQKNIKKILFFC